MLAEKVLFSIETTLATRSYLQLVKKVRMLGYEVILLFFALPSAEMAKERVALRVSKGGQIFLVKLLKEGLTRASETFLSLLK